jgi:predicted AAA+ superfamily ATPase
MTMERDLMLSLLSWKNDPIRTPLILRGARQVGKSWIIRAFGQYFDSYVELNFDEDEELHSLFNGRIDINLLLQKIQFYTEKMITPGSTLLFLDEIQECPQALKTLRYFKEKCPELHVIAAGSLLDFVLEKVGLPVGRVQFLYLYPLSFAEFLSVSGHETLREYIQAQQFTDEAIHKILIEQLKIYMWLGGMPAVVEAWLMFQNVEKCQALQERIITAYRQDFAKYAKKNQIDNVEMVFANIPYQIGKKFQYKDIDEGIRSTSLKAALSLLVTAGVAYECFHTSASGLPLAAGKNNKRFKVFLFDIGLAQRMMGLTSKEWITKPLEVKYLGGIAEQFVAQEYIAYSSPEKPYELYYWHREDKCSNAEIDFVFIKEGQIIPVEVKSGTKGGMKSLRQFLQMHPNVKTGLKISQTLRHSNPTLQEIAFYDLNGWLTESIES